MAGGISSSTRKGMTAMEACGLSQRYRERFYAGGCDAIHNRCVPCSAVSQLFEGRKHAKEVGPEIQTRYCLLRLAKLEAQKDNNRGTTGGSDGSSPDFWHGGYLGSPFYVGHSHRSICIDIFAFQYNY